MILTVSLIILPALSDVTLLLRPGFFLGVVRQSSGAVGNTIMVFASSKPSIFPSAVIIDIISAVDGDDPIIPLPDLPAVCATSICCMRSL